MQMRVFICWLVWIERVSESEIGCEWSSEGAGGRGEARYLNQKKERKGRHLRPFPGLNKKRRLVRWWLV